MSQFDDGVDIEVQVSLIGGAFHYSSASIPANVEGITFNPETATFQVGAGGTYNLIFKANGFNFGAPTSLSPSDEAVDVHLVDAQTVLARDAFSIDHQTYSFSLTLATPMVGFKSSDPTIINNAPPSPWGREREEA